MIRAVLFLILPILCFGEKLSISPEVARQIGQKVWKNECGGTLERLTYWNPKENFPSLGIGHFIWYPIGKKEQFDETFPLLLTFLQNEGIKLPDWLKNAKGCPWPSHEEFYRKINSPEVKQLRELLFETK